MLLPSVSAQFATAMDLQPVLSHFDERRRDCVPAIAYIRALAGVPTPVPLPGSAISDACDRRSGIWFECLPGLKVRLKIANGALRLGNRG